MVSNILWLLPWRWFILSTLVFITSCLPVNYSPYQSKKYYHKTKAAIAQLSILPENDGADTVKVGWAKVNITPIQKAPLAGYGKRKGAQNSGIHDSIFVRAFVFKNQNQKVAYVAMDLLIVPMSVRNALGKQLATIGFSMQNIYLTATHSHSSLGGWARKPAGYLMAGKYDKLIVNAISMAILMAIKQAEKNSATAQIGYAELEAGNLVKNRLNEESGMRDTKLRILKVKQVKNNKTAILCTFAAHATCLPASELQLSGDYPTALVQLLEKEKNIDFAAFSAGAVGSHSSAAPGEGFVKVNNTAAGLTHIISEAWPQIKSKYIKNINAVSVPLYLRAPHWRIAQNWRLHPIVFNLAFGKYPAFLTGFRLGDLLFLGTPCDFSGELALDLQNRQYQNKLIITSFNGGYIGYITPDKYYTLKKYETRDMNLFGPYNGAYLSEMMYLLLQKL